MLLLLTHGIIIYIQQLKTMIKQDDIIKAEEGKVLLYTPDNIIWGKAARLAKFKEHVLVESDFTEIPIDGLEVIDGVYYDFKNMSYAAIKTFIIKLHYSNDDQIAIMLNNEIDMSGEATERYKKMQEWREYATTIAKKYNK